MVDYDFSLIKEWAKANNWDEETILPSSINMEHLLYRGERFFQVICSPRRTTKSTKLIQDG